ncbi:MAG: gliding motility-associated C-terminal domain-containing protein [Sphingobacteriaceae bacterium]|nr:MAG: gliding motility-associated C-terminal domain-containing protein [Sphingobacteriaceae bacterium]
MILVPLVVPNTFTPNSDGINDTWDLRALLAYPDCLIQVFNRYGAMVYQRIGYTSGWDGTTGGRPLPVGTYYYLIDLKKGRQPLSGSLTILR